MIPKSDGRTGMAGSKLTKAMTKALSDACGQGLYHEFSNTSTVRALERRHLIRSQFSVGWYEATPAGRAALHLQEGSEQ